MLTVLSSGMKGLRIVLLRINLVESWEKQFLG